MNHAAPASGRATASAPSLSALANLLAETQRIGRIGGWEWDIQTGSHAWSEEMYRIFDHSPRADQPTLALLLERVHPDDVARVRSSLDASLEENKPFDVHHRIVLPNGAIRHVHQRGELAAGGGARGRRMIGTARDETEDVAREQELRRTNQALLTLSACNRALVAATDSQSLIDRMCCILVGVGRYGAAWMVSRDSAGDCATVGGLAAAEETKRARLLRSGGQFLAGGPVRIALDELAPQDWTVDGAAAVSAGWASMARGLGLQAVLALPLRDTAGAGAGALVIGRSGGHDFSDHERELLMELAADLSFGLTVLLLRQESTDRLRRLENSMEQTIQALSLTIEKRDPYTAGHQRRVAELAHAIGRRLGLTEDALHGLRLAATVHDIGKIYVPSDILSRPGQLTEGEFRIIKEHSRIGFDILKDIDLPWPVAQIVLQHHERIDGSGYPDGLKGDDILLGARIIGVADTVEAMASHRPYRAGLGVAAAIDEIRKNVGRRYDGPVVTACIEALEAGEGPEL